MTAFSDRIKEFADLNAEVLGVSLDTVFVHKAWIQTPRDKNGVGDIKYPLASDSTQQAARDYGVLIEEEGLAARGAWREFVARKRDFQGARMLKAPDQRS